jgi:ubiquinone/menaquinone biosynthesis C-methylase UbiE
MDVEKVKTFWGVEACGTHFVEAEKATPEFYEKYSRFRYQTEWHIPEIIPFSKAKGLSVLEIGCGNGADGIQFAKNGASYTGVDLTETAVEATRRHFEILGLKGTFQTENAEKLSFADQSFDWVYSHGVLHHTSNPAKAIDEVHRVLKPGGRALIMLYHKNSFNYWIRISGYMRGRALIKVFSQMGSWSKDRANLTQDVKGVRGNIGQSVWQIHYENFLRNGFSYFKASNFVHHATDGPECPYAFAYTKSEARNLFKKYKNVEFSIAHFPLRKYISGTDVHPVEKMLAKRLGWYLFIEATK